MITHACPHCDDEIHSPDDLAGMPILCPHCHQHFDVPRSAKHSDETLIRASASHPDETGPCLFCHDQPAAGVCYVRVYRPSDNVTEDVATAWNDVQSYACDGCYRKLHGLQRLRGIAIGWMLGLPVLLAAGWLVLAWMEGAGTVSRDTVNNFLIVGGIACVLNVLLTPLWLNATLNRRIGRMLDPDADRSLKTMGGFRTWGLRNPLYVERTRLGKGECVELRRT